ncbi:uncharacterized protein [Apostichopus japonicus]|uniref:uncharacterized protein isoform X1 n=1 Tax=Stichopus japonicus TaxID=307972 RepID=UPI003AB3A4EA
MDEAVNQQIAPENQQPITNVQQPNLQNDDNKYMQLPRISMGIVIFLCGSILVIYPLTTPDLCHIYNVGCWGIVNGLIAIITGCVGVLSGKTNNKCVNIGFRILALVASHMSGIFIILQASFARLVQDAGSYLLVGILACEFTACIIGSLLTCRDITKCCVKQFDRVVVYRPDVAPPANEEDVNPANRPPTKAIPMPDHFFTA